MKKFGLGLLIVGAIMMVSVCAFALTPISNSQMASITAQSGVDIAVDDVVMYNHFDNITYTDNDGISTPAGTITPAITDTAASVNLANISMTTYINAIEYSVTSGAWQSVGGSLPLRGLTNYAGNAYKPAGPNGYGYASPLTIDVGTMPVLTAGYTLVVGNGTTAVPVVGVKIGLPTLEIYVPTLTVEPTVAGVGYNNGFDYGTISIAGMTTAILGGHMEIAPH